MRIFELRKYFFANMSALSFYILIFFVINYAKNDYPPPGPNDFLAPGFGEFMLMVMAIILLVFLYLITILEILIRKYIIERKFPNLKLNIKIKIPKFVVAIYNVIFFVGFIPSCMVFAIVLFHTIAAIFSGIFS